MAKQHDPNELSDLPACAGQFIRHVIKKMRYRRRARAEVQAELAGHFAEELRACNDPEERERRARRLIEEFGDPKLLALLCRRAKKRCRPLWAAMLVRTTQAGAALVLLFGLYMIWFASGKPDVRVDYLTMLSQMSRPQIPERDNAWPLYQQAFARVVEPNEELADLPGFSMIRAEPCDFASLAIPQQDAVAKWVSANRSAWERFQAGSVKPYCWRPCQPGDANEPQWLFSLLPHLKPLRQVALAGIWRCRIEVQQGQTAEALEDCLTVARAGRHWQLSGLLVEQLVGVTLSRTAHEEILRVLSRQSLSAPDLAELQRKIAALYPEGYPLVNLEGQRLGFLDTVQRVFTEGGPGGGHMIPAWMASLSTEGGDGEWFDAVLANAVALVHAGRNQTVAKADELFELAKKRVRLTPYEKHGGSLMAVDEMLMSLSRARYCLLYILTPAVDRCGELAFQARALHQATLTILALLRCRAEKGAFPASLEALKQAGYLDMLPADPYSDGIVSYRATGDNFTLYSVGPNFRDDRGRPGSKSRKSSTLWSKDGDAVFWPVAP
jgi:hypothetical protein